MYYFAYRKITIVSEMRQVTVTMDSFTLMILFYFFFFFIFHFLQITHHILSAIWAQQHKEMKQKIKSESGRSEYFEEEEDEYKRTKEKYRGSFGRTVWT